MILEHAFNSRWWGSPIGISSEVHDLFLEPEELTSALQSFDWIEFRVPFKALPEQMLGPTNGARMVETQLTYKKNISKLTSCPEGITIIIATEMPIDVMDFSAFTSERYLKLAGVTSERLAIRYQLFASHLVEEYPGTCATVFYKSSLVGYIFGHIDEATAVFDLAVSSTQAHINGQILYEAAGHLFNGAGANTMTSSFNAANIGALNSHVRMQCRFVEATSIWLLESKIQTPEV